jgi:cob(I)alamin adenosyltransferase
MPHPIYTRRGDAGETRTLAGRTMKKGSAQARALGALDELNAAMGLARARSMSRLWRGPSTAGRKPCRLWGAS